MISLHHSAARICSYLITLVVCPFLQKIPTCHVPACPSMSRPDPFLGRSLICRDLRRPIVGRAGGTGWHTIDQPRPTMIRLSDNSMSTSALLGPLFLSREQPTFFHLDLSLKRSPLRRSPTRSIQFLLYAPLVGRPFSTVFLLLASRPSNSNSTQSTCYRRRWSMPSACDWMQRSTHNGLSNSPS